MRDRLDQIDDAVTFRDRPEAQAGFTLIELVVVLAVIAVLMAMLLPAIAKARSHAKSLECSSNVKQICLALLNYAAEAKGSFPPNVSTPAPGRFWYHERVIGPYLNYKW